MILNFRFAVLGLATLIISAGVLLSAKASDWDKKTVLTFSAPVEVPGKVLPQGTYVFKLVDSQSSRNIVQVFTEDEKEVMSTILAVPAYRLDPVGDTVITFEERAAGNPEAVKDWFFPGDNRGLEFVYLNQR